MSSFMNLSFLDEIKPYKNKWRIQVKVLHSWKSYIPGVGESLELILSDAHGTKIHASCKKAYLEELGDKLPVGSWRNIENFLLTAPGGMYKSTNHAYKLSFLHTTEISVSSLQMDDLFLSLVDFETILSGKLDEYKLIDVIGQVKDLGDLESVQCQGKPRKKIEFVLGDIHGQTIACCLWGTFAEKIHTEVEASGEYVVVCLLRFAKIGKYRGEIQISNSFDASQLIINPLIKETEEFQLMEVNEDSNALTLVDSKDQKLQLKTRRDKWMQFPLKYIGELLEPTQAEVCRVVCTVSKIDRNWGWYYFGCNDCDKKAIKLSTNTKRVNVKDIVSHVWWCEQCKRKVYDVSPRFKLHLMVKDDTGVTHFMLLDTIAKGLVPVSAETLLNGSFDELEDIDSFPEAITSLVGKTFMFGVYIEKDHVTCKAETFKVGKVWKDMSMDLSGSASVSCTKSDLDTTICSGEQESIHDMNNQSSDDVLSTPSSKRRDESDEYVHDLTSTSKKQCTKSIKKEKMGYVAKNSKKSG